MSNDPSRPDTAPDDQPDARFTRSAVIVVNYGSTDLLASNLTVLTRAAPGLTTVIVDNFTSALERENLRHLAAHEDWILVEPPVNLGFGVGMNRGVDAAHEHGAERFLLLNPDAVITADAAADLFATVERDPRALVAPRILRPDGSVWFAGSDLYLDDGRIRSRRRRLDSVPADRIEPWLTGACLAVSLELWTTVGGFSDDYFLYWEDVDLSRRVVDAGGSLVLRDDVTAEHAQGGTQATGHSSAGQPKSATYYYYNIRNRLLFAAVHLDDADFRAWSRHSRAVAWEILLQGGRRQLLDSTAPLRAAFRGLRDGRRLARRIRRSTP
ncbi:glycosyltransferase family 2 protein [Labedella populi]|uniref:Glycosyltransferase family 2 protein n=1 Tax=Labedella populi TaxID=2498850 RepID=A0A3S4AGT1_9MICO|nr:glycosyltransferase family 2 protein [Labedella populi]RWZ59560.1 glycosyltransferase family 2 protein [Labedella populi]